MQSGPESHHLRIPYKVRRELRLLIRRQRESYAVVQRARIVLFSHQRMSTSEIASKIGWCDRTVRKWKARFICNPTIEGIRDGTRTGRPARIDVQIRCELVKMACDRPDNKGIPFRNIWTYAALADAVAEKTGCRMSISEVGRTLRYQSLRPHRVRQWLKSADKDFTAKAKRICELYLNPPDDAIVLCVDEKPMQVLQRCCPTRVDHRDASIRYEYEYKRHGNQVLLAAYNIKTGGVFGQVVPQRTSKRLVSFMNAVARRYPNRDIYIVWDNLNTHYDGPEKRWSRFNDKHAGRFHFFYTPIHASWMNQVEIWFSILHRRVLKLGDFASPQEQKSCVEGFITHWNRTERHPFRWTWRTDKRQTV